MGPTRSTQITSFTLIARPSCGSTCFRFTSSLCRHPGHSVTKTAVSALHPGQKKCSFTCCVVRCTPQCSWTCTASRAWYLCECGMTILIRGFESNSFSRRYTNLVEFVVFPLVNLSDLSQPCTVAVHHHVLHRKLRCQFFFINFTCFQVEPRFYHLQSTVLILCFLQVYLIYQDFTFKSPY